ncbi:response regulator [Alteromonas sp. S167]|uniref:response regulator n=1 Tax=Alteromonas sp. S167 TaxID=3117402 RepID=UPI002FE100DE
MTIRTRYIVALLLTASLVTLSFTVLYNLIGAQKLDAEIINIAGQQRMLSQRIALFANTKAVCGTEDKRQSFINAVNKFKTNHQRLINLEDLSSPIQAIYFGDVQLDKKVKSFISQSEMLYQARNCEANETFSINNVSVLLTLLNDVVDLFEQEASQRVDFVATIEIYLWLGTLTLLVLEAIFIFSPMEKEIRSSISRLTSLKVEAENAALEAKKASQAKSEFLSSMSHELRTPMNGLFGMIELSIDNPSKGSMYLKKAKTAGRQLLVLINDILDISKIEAGKIKIEKAPVDLLQVLDDVVSLQRVYCQRKGLNFHYNKQAELPHIIEGDITRISQVLHNLLSNAIKFTEKGSVTLDVRVEQLQDSMKLIFDVVDTGIGITEEKLPHIFDKFEQADQSTTRVYGGTGLGLSIAQQLARLMGGDIAVMSKEGEGSTFSFHMVAHPSKLPDITITPSTSLRCAVVDDLQTSREYFDHIVVSAGIYSKSFESAAEFLADDPFSYDVIILDLSMPEMSGIDLLKALAKQNKEIPKVILISAELERMQNEDDMSDMIWRTHAKPINRRELEQDLSKLLKQPSKTSHFHEAPVKSQRILLAEDNEINAEIVKTMLQAEGYKILHVKNGKDALEACKRHTFDFILMDCNMPIMGGIEASLHIRNTLKLETPIAALTANAFVEDKEECLGAGMNDFLTKPLDKETLLACIVKYIGPN